MPTMSQNLYAVLPVFIIMITGMIILIGDSCVASWRNSKAANWFVSLTGIFAAMLIALRQLSDNPAQAFGGAVIADAFSTATYVILLITAALAVLLATSYLENKNLHLGEYYALVLFSTSGAMLMASANDLITLFVAIEILSVALYVLSGFLRADQKSEESALKYFLLGAFAAGFLLYGIALVYGGSAAPGHAPTTNLTDIGHLLRDTAGPSVMLMAGVALVLVGLAFKAALVPFHMWTPDVYEGAPTSVTAYMAAAAKIGAFAAILRVFNALIPIAEYWLLAIQVLAVLTMFGGNILAVFQENVKRMLAYSSIAHAGYLLVGVVAATAGSKEAHDTAFAAITFYLLAYTLMTMGAFGVLIYLSKRGHDVQTLKDLKGLARRDSTAAYLMLIFMLSLGGVPPTMGFMGKWLLFNATLLSGQTWLAITLAFASIISIFYYLKVVWTMCFQEPDTDAAQDHSLSPGGVTISLVVTAGASVLLGIAPRLVEGLMNAASTVVRP